MAEENQQRHVAVNAQYIKDLSFENPKAPQSLANMKEFPQIGVSVDIQVNKMEEKSYEVALVISAEAKQKDESVFVCELVYGGVFTVDVPEAELEPVLMVYCPTILFPYARRVISDVTRDGGFPPMMLDPIDFAALYQKFLAEREEGEKKEKAQ